MFHNESWCVTGRSAQEEQLVLVRGESGTKPCLSFYGDVIGGTPPGWRGGKTRLESSTSRWDTQRCSFLFFLTSVCNCDALLVSTFPEEAAGLW